VKPAFNSGHNQQHTHKEGKPFNAEGYPRIPYDIKPR